MVILKKFKTFIFALAAVLLIPTSAFANTGGPNYTAGWQTKASGAIDLWEGKCESVYALSGGGDIRVRITEAQASTYWNAYVYEQDPSNGTETFISSNYGLGDDDIIFSGISNYVDGDWAELRICIGYASANETAHYEIDD